MTALIAQPRLYQGPDDLDAMRRILIAGGQAYLAGTGGPAFYVHVGDLSWWFFYSEHDYATSTYLWAAEPGGEPVAWVLFSPWHTFDLFVHPTAVTAEQRLALFTWAEEHLAAEISAAGGQRMSTIWISEHDGSAIAHLTARGFQRATGDNLVFMARRLDNLDPAPPLPPDFQIRPVAGEHEVEMRAAAQHSAFESSWDMERYVARYRRFMRSDVYEPQRDLVVVAPDGRAAAFCFVWLDEVNRVGHFEPVGTHADFRRQGLGKAVLWAGLSLMKRCGMEMATVCPYGSSEAAMGLYRAAGFRPIHQMLTFSKEVAQRA
jgi:ribosomal protein S18 acetylase RimI-like enzyme